MRFGKRGKLRPRYIGPFEVLQTVEKVAYFHPICQQCILCFMFICWGGMYPISCIRYCMRSWSSISTYHMRRRPCGSWIAVQRPFVRRRCCWSMFFGSGVALRRRLGHGRTRWGSFSLACSLRLLHVVAFVLLSCLAFSLWLLFSLLLRCTLGAISVTMGTFTIIT